MERKPLPKSGRCRGREIKKFQKEVAAAAAAAEAAEAARAAALAAADYTREEEVWSVFSFFVWFILQSLCRSPRSSSVLTDKPTMLLCILSSLNSSLQRFVW